MISRFYQPSGGGIFFAGVEITPLPPPKIAQLGGARALQHNARFCHTTGVARTFQNIELFDNATVLANLLVGRHRHRRTRIYEDILFLPKVRAAEYADRHRVEEVIEFLDLQRYRAQLIAALPYGVRRVGELARTLCPEPKILL